MNLKTIPFSEQENKKTYKLLSFNELNLKINILNEITTSSRKIPSGNNYKFGVIIQNNFYWYFNGNSVAKDRDKMRLIYSALLEVNKETGNTPFIFKIKK
jgi:hypothetical protein